jgi:hypothetical protein
MDYTVESANRLAAELRAIPPKNPAQRRLDKQGMVRLLAEEIIALQQRGYTIEDVAESLRGRGLDITTPTLKNYLQRAKGKAEKRSKGKPRATRPAGRDAARETQKRDKAGSSAAAVASTTPAPKQPTDAPALPPVAEAGALRSGKGAFLVKDKDSY